MRTTRDLRGFSGQSVSQAGLCLIIEIHARVKELSGLPPPRRQPRSAPRPRPLHTVFSTRRVLSNNPLCIG